MKTFKVIKAGVSLDGVPAEVGSTVELEPSGGQVRAWIHFGQLEEVGAPKKEKKKSAAELKAEAADKAAADKAAAGNGGDK